MASYSEVGEYLLGKLCTSLDLRSELPEFSAMQRFLFQGWGDTKVPSEAPYASLIGDDHSPFEYSVAFGGRGLELRILFEVQAAVPGAMANCRAALALNERLAEHYGTSLARFSAVQDLFLSNTTSSGFSLWHGVRFSADNPDFKVYMNPQAFGPQRALPLVREALARLELHAAIPIVEHVIGSRGGRDSLNYFSLDLSGEESARVKVYFRHAQATPRDIEKLFAGCAMHQPGDVVEFTRAMVGHEGFLGGKPVTSCFAFTRDADGPSAVTYHLPIAHYAPDDATAVQRSVAYLSAHDQAAAAERFAAAVAAFAPRALDCGVGVQSYASYRREPTGIRFTAYLSPELFREAQGYRSGSRLRSCEACEGQGLVEIK